MDQYEAMRLSEYMKPFLSRISRLEASIETKNTEIGDLFRRVRELEEEMGIVGDRIEAIKRNNDLEEYS